MSHFCVRRCRTLDTIQFPQLWSCRQLCCRALATPPALCMHSLAAALSASRQSWCAALPVVYRVQAREAAFHCVTCQVLHSRTLYSPHKKNTSKPAFKCACARNSKRNPHVPHGRSPHWSRASDWWRQASTAAGPCWRPAGLRTRLGCRPCCRAVGSWRGASTSCR
jgi:hypothetical protein